ncbi:MAG: thioesterase family protein [Solirubrobacterales bacterium]|nr:thioesterase family protein [Solirubrobacterales bacterium]
MTHPFDSATAVTHVAEGRWATGIDAGWFAPMGPNGGYLASIVLRALTEAVADPERAPRSLNLHYLRPPVAGPAEVAVTVERTGRSLTTLSARLEQDGRLCVLALAAFAVDMPSAVDYAAAAPEATPYAELPPSPQPAGTPPITKQLDVRPAIGPWPFSGADEARTGGWLQFPEPRVADAFACATWIDAWWPAPFVRLTAPIGAPTIDLSIHFRVRLPLDAGTEPVLGLFTSRSSAQGFFEEDAELWSTGGVLLAQGRQLALARPLR